LTSSDDFPSGTRLCGRRRSGLQEDHHVFVGCQQGQQSAKFGRRVRSVHTGTVSKAADSDLGKPPHRIAGGVAFVTGEGFLHGGTKKR
jgi:hypothetical protein